MRIAISFPIVLLIGFTHVSAILGQASEFIDASFCRIPYSPSIVYSATIDLPAEGVWYTNSFTSHNVAQIYMTPSKSVEFQQLGTRMQSIIHEKRSNQGQWAVRSIYDACLEFARNHNGFGPAKLSDLPPLTFEHLEKQVRSVPWTKEELESVRAVQPSEPYVFVVPNANFEFDRSNQRFVPTGRREVLAVELHPYVNDGRHWVQYTDGKATREKVDEQFAAKHGIKISPVLSEAIPDPKPKTLPYRVVVVSKGETNSPIEFEIRNHISDEARKFSWTPKDLKQDSANLEQLKVARQYAWTPYLRTGPAPILKTWLSNKTVDQNNRRNNRRSGNSSSMLAMLGGRAAIEETLQLQVLREFERADESTVRISSIAGVDVRSHPFQKMLGEKPGGRLELANYVPADRFFIYVGKPKSIVPFIDRGAEFLASTGAGLTGNRLNYDLANRYLNKLGIHRKLLEKALNSGFIQDLAISMPDLFLIDGTDFTIVMRLRNAQLIKALLAILEVKNASGANIASFRNQQGVESFWLVRDGILCVSTNRAEAERTAGIIKNHGEGSLGNSIEFRYMLTQVPVESNTRMFAYFSDPFVRRLVGPQVKIGQLRRMKTRQAMELMTSARLLAQLNGISQNLTVNDLMTMEYLPKEFPVSEFSFDQNGVAKSRSYGTLQEPKSLLSVPIETVSESEKESYQLYLANYSRYWRQFFDPIAIRLNDGPDDSLDLTTFILPLIDSSIYNRAKEILLRRENQVALTVPKITPTPIFQISANLNETYWRELTSEFSTFFTRYGGASPALLDDLGPAFHLAIADADPIIALGSGDIMGAFGGDLMRGGRSEMMMVPFLLSMLTRPCTILIETQDAKRTAQFLRQAATSNVWKERRNNDFSATFYQVEDRDAWVWSLSVVGVVKLRYGIEVNDRYVVIRNIPWSGNDRVESIQQASLASAAIQANPAACQLQLPSLFAAAADQDRRAEMSSLGRIYPFLVLNGGNFGEATRQHQQLYGFHPISAASSEWKWKSLQLESSAYGSPWKQRQPEYQAGRPFGLMQNVESLNLSMQFEDAGLRSNITWKMRKAKR